MPRTGGRATGRRGGAERRRGPGFLARFDATRLVLVGVLLAAGAPDPAGLLPEGYDSARYALGGWTAWILGAGLVLGARRGEAIRAVVDGWRSVVAGAALVAAAHAALVMAGEFHASGHLNLAGALTGAAGQVMAAGGAASLLVLATAALPGYAAVRAVLLLWLGAGALQASATRFPGPEILPAVAAAQERLAGLVHAAILPTVPLTRVLREPGLLWWEAAILAAGCASALGAAALLIAWRTRRRLRSPLAAFAAAAACLAALLGGRYAWGEWPSELVRWRVPDAAVEEARREGRPVLYWFTATWSRPCTAMSRELFRTREGSRLVNGSFVPVKVWLHSEDGGRRTPGAKALEQAFAVGGVPTLVVVRPSGEVLRSAGYRGGGRVKDRVAAWLRRAARPAEAR